MEIYYNMSIKLKKRCTVFERRNPKTRLCESVALVEAKKLHQKELGLIKEIQDRMLERRKTDQRIINLEEGRRKENPLRMDEGYLGALARESLYKTDEENEAINKVETLYHNNTIESYKRYNQDERLIKRLRKSNPEYILSNNPEYNDARARTELYDHRGPFHIDLMKRDKSIIARTKKMRSKFSPTHKFYNDPVYNDSIAREQERKKIDPTHHSINSIKI